MTFDINYIILVTLGVLALFVKGKKFKIFYYLFLPILASITAAYKGKLYIFLMLFLHQCL